MSRGGESKTDIWVQVTISLGLYRFTVGLEFLFITFLPQFFLAQMSSLLMSSSAIYSSTFSNHIYVSVYLKGIMHQGSALFGVVPSEASSGIPSELLYADDLVLMAVVCHDQVRCQILQSS